MSFLASSLLVMSKDLRLEVRGRHALNLLLPFVGATLMVLGLALGPGRQILRATAPALLWVTALFASLLGARSTFQTEEHDGALRALLLSPIDKGAIFAGKVLALSITLLGLLLVAGLGTVVLFGLSVGPDPWPAAVGFALGALGLSALTILFGALVVSARAREAVLPMLVLPLAVPLALAGVRTTALGLDRAPSGALSWLGLLGAFDLVIVGFGLLLFEWVLEE